LFRGTSVNSKPTHDAVRREVLRPDRAMHVPHQQGHVEVLGLQPAAHPARAPFAHHHDQGLKLAAGIGQMILEAAAGRALPALDHPFLLQELQALREQRRRHQRHAEAQIIETRAATDQLAQNQRRPTLRKDLRRLGDRAELAIAAHATIIRPVEKTASADLELVAAGSPCDTPRS
jgi:hypothetical protein